ncbi:LysM domain-containing protein [Colletotrichum karsti]|uniref:LysM domain-containing protein n=1 Tax=Colletotrichum karsti TaxID=1095194 RepID=A0A9P6IDL0_9PEZI|nr:LysM domain-containing protein [Colletotrichum karsti]KAF9881457.1 LysM domain-containing protein [Colletotrichum karsti]
MSILRYSLILVAASAFQVNALKAAFRDAEPKYPSDPNTTPYCSWWYDNEGTQACARVLSDNFITLEDFRRWNPSIGASCSGFEAEHSYCIEAWGEPEPEPQPGTTTVTSTTLATSTTKPITTTTTTLTGNGISTPLPTQPSMVDNCNKFYFVEEGTGCSQVLSANGITIADLFKWNPSVKSDCSGMWALVNVCVGVIGGGGGAVTTTAKPTTTTTAGNGIVTPQPTQPSMVSNCNKFYFVASGTSCSQVLTTNGISLADLFKWNPSVNSDCSGMWAQVNVCVGVMGGSPTTTKPTTTTSAGNGIQTPQPTQPGMVTNCKKFHYVSEGNTCDQIISYNKITLADFVKWNTGVGSDCRSMWAKTYVCVGV